MKIKSTFRKNNKTGMTPLLMLALVGISVTVFWRISQMEEQACWEVLRQSVRQIREELEIRIHGDQELLSSIADIAAAREDVESQEVQAIIDGFRPNTMISNIALLLPGDRVMLPGEPVRDAVDVLPFEEEAALGRHISGRSVDIRDEERQILRSFVPVIQCAGDPAAGRIFLLAHADDKPGTGRKAETGGTGSADRAVEPQQL